MYIHGVRRAWLEELVGLTVRQVSERLDARWGEEWRATRDEPLRYCVQAGAGDPVLTNVVGPDVTLAAHLRDHALDLLWLVPAFARRGEALALVEGHRRWWLGSLAHALAERGFRHRPDASAALSALRALVGPFDTGCAWFDALAPASNRVFADGRDEDGWAGDVELAALVPLLDAATDIERFEAPPERHGLGPARDDVAAWTEWVGGNVRALRAARADVDHLISVVL